MSVRKGFTLVELSLSLAFISVLSLTIALIINNSIASYRRGITLKRVNTTGMGLVDDMRAAIQNSSTKSVSEDCTVAYSTSSSALDACESGGASKFVSLTREADLIGGLKKVPIFGVFCTGSYSYIWNSGYFFNNENGAYKVPDAISSAKLRLSVDSGVADNAVCKREGTTGNMQCSNFKLLKIKDESRAVCIKAVGSNYNNTTASNLGSDFNIIGAGSVASDAPIDLLASDEGDSGLAIYNISVAGPAESKANALFYSVSFILGTIQGGANIMKSGGFCATPDEYANENFDYCSINKFNFATEATGV